MKLLMLMGGALGFGIGLLCSRSRENSWVFCLLHATLGAYVGAWLMGWWGRAWQKNLEERETERQIEAERLAAAAPPQKTSKT